MSVGIREKKSFLPLVMALQKVMTLTGWISIKKLAVSVLKVAP
jgi:hypothetical protein